MVFKKALTFSICLLLTEVFSMTPKITFAEAERERVKWTVKKQKPQDEVDFAVSNRFFRYSTSIIPHKDKLERGGEDAYYASDSLLSVADGVGGWANRGIDAGRYSKSLIWYI